MLPVPWHQATIVSLQHLNARTLMVVFRLENADSVKIPLLLGQHISLRVSSKGQTINRSYSIVNDAAQQEVGRIHLIVRLVPDGAMSTALSELAASLQSETVSAPAEKFDVAFTQPTLTFAPNQHRCVILLAAGTGITPFFNVIRAILETLRTWCSCGSMPPLPICFRQTNFNFGLNRLDFMR
jgi:ferredoxin-NADP reductase